MCEDDREHICRISFIGHSDFLRNPRVEQLLFNALSEEIGGQYTVEFYFGGYGNFDAFAYEMAKKYQAEHPDAEMKFIFVTPYMTESYQKNHLNPIRHKYDEILYPPIEGKPLRYAITYRNRYMMDISSKVVAYVSRRWGGAWQTYRYAVKRNRKVINLYEKEKNEEEIL